MSDHFDIPAGLTDEELLSVLNDRLRRLAEIASGRSITLGGDLDAAGFRILNLGEPTSPNDAISRSAGDRRFATVPGAAATTRPGSAGQQAGDQAQQAGGEPGAIPDVTIGTPVISYFVDPGTLERRVRIEIPFDGPANADYRGVNVWLEIPPYDSATPADPTGGIVYDQGWHWGEPSSTDTAVLILPRPGRDETWRVYMASRSETRSNPLVLSTEASPTPYVDVDIVVSSAVNVTAFSLTGSDPATYGEGGRAIVIPFEFTLPAGASWEVIDWDRVEIEIKTSSMGASDKPVVSAVFDRASGNPGDTIQSLSTFVDLPTTAETWTFTAVSYSLTGQRYSGAPTDTVGVTTPSALGITAPGPVTINGAGVTSAAFADDATGEMRVRIRVPYVAPSPLNGFDGVEVYVEAPGETSSTPLDPTGEIVYPQGWHWWDPAGAAEQFVELILPYPWRAEGWHIYLSSRRAEYANPLVLSTGGSPTPYVLVSLGAPAAAQVANFSLGTPTYPAGTKSVVVPFSFDLPTASNWRYLDWDRVQIEVRTSTMSGTDKPVIAAVFDRDSGLPGDTIESAMTFTDLPEANESWTFDAVSYRRNGARMTGYPSQSATIGPPAALPLPANVTGFTATVNTLKNEAGVWLFQLEGSWTNPTDQYFVGVEVVGIWTGDTREIILAIEKEGATAFRTDYWPMQESTQEITIKAYAINQDGIRQTASVPSATFNVVPPATGGLKLNRADAATVGAGLQVSGSTLRIPDAGIVSTLLADLSVTQAKVQDAAINTAKLANLSVNNSKLQDLAVDAAKLASSSVTSTKIANLAVGTAAIANAAVGTLQVADAAIVTAKIGDLAVTTAKIGLAQVGTAQIVDAAITNAKVGDMSVAKLTAGTASFTGDVTFANSGNISMFNGGTITVNPGTFTGAIIRSLSVGVGWVITPGAAASIVDSGVNGAVEAYRLRARGQVELPYAADATLTFVPVGKVACYDASGVFKGWIPVLA